MALKTKKRTITNGSEGIIQIDEYLYILKRFGIPTSESDNLDAEFILPFKLIFNTTLNTLRIYNSVTETWQDAINADLSQFYTKNEIDLLFSNVTIELTRLNGLKLEANTATATIYLKDGNDNILSTLNVGFLNNEGSTFVYNAITSTLDLINDELTILSSIPVSSFISNLSSQINFNGILSNRLELKDSSNNVLSYVDITINNISGLQNALDNKEPLITILPITKGGTGKNSITENNFYVGGPLNTLNEKTIDEVFDLLLISGNGINFLNRKISAISANNDRIIVNSLGIDLAETSVTPGNYKGFEIDQYGRITSVTQIEPINSQIVLFRKGSNSNSINIEINDICSWVSPSGELKFLKYINYTTDNNTQNINNYIEGISMF